MKHWWILSFRNYDTISLRNVQYCVGFIQYPNDSVEHVISYKIRSQYIILRVYKKIFLHARQQQVESISCIVIFHCRYGNVTAMTDNESKSILILKIARTRDAESFLINNADHCKLAVYGGVSHSWWRLNAIRLNGMRY